MIKAVNVTKIYYQGKAKIEAVKSASLEVAKNTSIIITGSSGAGKSTFLHLLGGLDRPTKGVILFEGMDFYSMPDRMRSGIRNSKIGFVFQFYHLLPEFTALENVMLPGMMRKRGKALKKIRKRAEHLLNMVKLGHRKDHRPAQLSGGESQRTAIARALINSPQILLCDEPTGNLDSKIGKDIIGCLRMLKEAEGMAMVIVTHDEEMYKDFGIVYRIKDGVLEKSESKAGWHSGPEAVLDNFDDINKMRNESTGPYLR